MHERTKTNASRRNTIKLDLRDWTAVPKTVRRIQNTIENVSRQPTNHLGATFSITLRQHLLPHELTLPTTSQVIECASENSVDPQPSVTDTKHGGYGSYTIQRRTHIADRPYTGNTKGRGDASSRNQVNQYC